MFKTQVEMKSTLTNVVHVRIIDVDPKKLQDWRSGKLKGFVQDVFPELSADDREFILTGITQEEWDSAFAEGQFDGPPEDDKPEPCEYEGL